MANFRCLSEHFLVEAESVCRDLMFDVLPDVNLGEIKDDLINKGRSFSASIVFLVCLSLIGLGTFDAAKPWIVTEVRKVERC
jgi:hypothetical protein